MLYFDVIANKIVKYYYIYILNNTDYNTKDIELPILERQNATADLSYLIV